MADTTKPTRDEMTMWAKRHGLDRLSPEHIDRLAELSVYVSELGPKLRRVPQKQDAPSPIISRAPDRDA